MSSMAEFIVFICITAGIASVVGIVILLVNQWDNIVGDFTETFYKSALYDETSEHHVKRTWMSRDYGNFQIAEAECSCGKNYSNYVHNGKIKIAQRSTKKELRDHIIEELKFSSFKKTTGNFEF